jgi:hypothetical protein
MSLEGSGEPGIPEHWFDLPGGGESGRASPGKDLLV